MARFVDVHPDNPQPRALRQAADVLRGGGVIVYPTDSCYALGCLMGEAAALERIRAIRAVDRHHHFTLVCRDFAQLGQLVTVSTAAYRIVRACTPGPYTFILPATREIPRRMLHPKKHTVGVRIPQHVTTQALLAELGEPLLSSTLLLPGQEEPPTIGWEIAQTLEHQVDVVLDSGDCGVEPTTVVDLSDGAATVLRVGAGDVSRFQSED